MIYIITTETFPNGLAATQRIKCYARCIVALGHSCQVLCVNRCEDIAKPLGNVNAQGFLEGYEYRYIGGSTHIGKAWRNKWYQISDTLRLILTILFSFSNNDVIILYSYNSVLLRLVKRCAKIRGIKVYFELNEHPSILHSVFGVCGETEHDLAIVKDTLNGFDGILCISSALRELLVRSGLQVNKVHVVNMLVDPSRFDGVYKQETVPYIGYCGAADNNKDGVDRLIKAFVMIAGNYPKLQLFIMGPKNADSKNEELVKKLGIEDRVVFTGMINPKRMPQMLVNAHLLALARPQSVQAKYGFPTKLGEYLLTGNPVVVTGVGDIPRFLKDGESAFIANPDDVNSFAERLDYVLSNPVESKQVGECGRGVALKNFSGKQIMSQLKEAMNL